MTEQPMIHVGDVQVYTDDTEDGIFVKHRGDNRFILLSELRELATTDHPVEIS